MFVIVIEVCKELRKDIHFNTYGTEDSWFDNAQKTYLKSTAIQLP